MERGIKYGHHGSIFAEYILTCLHSNSLRRIVKRTQVFKGRNIFNYPFIGNLGWIPCRPRCRGEHDGQWRKFPSSLMTLPSPVVSISMTARMPLYGRECPLNLDFLPSAVVWVISPSTPILSQLPFALHARRPYQSADISAMSCPH